MYDKNMKNTIGYKTVILLVLSHECETWSLIKEAEHGLRVYEKMVLRNIFVDKTEDGR